MISFFCQWDLHDKTHTGRQVRSWLKWEGQWLLTASTCIALVLWEESKRNKFGKWFRTPKFKGKYQEIEQNQKAERINKYALLLGNELVFYKIKSCLTIKDL